MICGIVTFCKCYKRRRSPKTNQKPIKNYCKRSKTITERIEVTLLKNCGPVRTYG